VSDQNLNDLLKEFDNPHHCYPQILVDTIRLLVKERDEARREVCEWEHHWDKTSSEQYYADKRGWDCFKDNA